MYELLAAGIANILQWKYLLPLFIGTLVGVVGGALPGITITMTVIVVLPFTFGLEPLQGLAAMIGVYVGGETGGLITSCLLGIPGKPSAVATTFDGFPMVRRRASPAARCGSASGPRSSAACSARSSSSAPPGRSLAFALQFGPWEYFSLFVLALSMVAGLVEASLAKGLLSGALGLIVTVLGNDPVMGQPRLTLRHRASRGRHRVPAGADRRVRLRADHVGGGAHGRRGSRGRARDRAIRLVVSHRKVIWEIVSRPFLLLWSSFIGLVIGVLPAIGGSAANMLAYDQAKKFSRHPEKFGTGTPEGIIASEASNNANVAGSLVTIMAFGIPGDAVTAVMLGALTIHGIQSGPLFISQNAHARLRHVRRLHPRARARAGDPAGRRALDAAHRRQSRRRCCSRSCWCCA